MSEIKEMVTLHTLLLLYSTLTKHSLAPFRKVSRWTHIFVRTHIHLDSIIALKMLFILFNSFWNNSFISVINYWYCRATNNTNYIR